MKFCITLVCLLALCVVGEDIATEAIPNNFGSNVVETSEHFPDEESEEISEDKSEPKPAVVPPPPGQLTDLEDFTSLEETGEAYEFQAEVNRLMDIIINSIYTQKEVFLRELISNSADALEKIRFMSISNPDILEDTKELRVIVETDREKKTVSITDTGVGMTKNELINNLGTVAKSGTSNFLEAIAHGADVNLIGQFGVGFYSAFLVADRVTVTSKHPDHDQHIWQSAADAKFSIFKDPRGNTLGRGTRITLHLKEDALEFLDEERTQDVLKKYSQFVPFPLYFNTKVLDATAVKSEDGSVAIDADAEKSDEEKEKEDKGEDESEEEQKETEEKEDSDGKEEEKKDDSGKPEKPKELPHHYELVLLNNEKPIWLRSKDNVTLEEYEKFYKEFTRDTKKPLDYIHFSAEGEVEFKALLYIPEKLDQDPYQNYFGTQQHIKMYVRRVLVADKFSDLLPKWLNFIKGVVDSDDLPLKVDRESLIQDKVMKVISKRLGRKAVDVFKKMANDAELAEEEISDMKEKRIKEAENLNNECKEKKQVDEMEECKMDYKQEDLVDEAESTKIEELKNTTKRFNNFWKVYGRNMKLGIQDEDSRASRPKLAKILRFKTSKSGDEWVSLQQYKNNMKEDQKEIYYLTGESRDKMFKSPHMQFFLKKEIEVLFLDETLDEPIIIKLANFDGTKIVSIEKGTIDIRQDEQEYMKKLEKHYEDLTKWWNKFKPFGIQRVILSKKLVKDPVSVVASEYGFSPFAERVIRYQTFRDIRSELPSQRVLEINPQHKLIREMLDRVKANPDDPELKKRAELLMQAGLIASGFLLDDPVDFAAEVYKYVGSKMNLENIEEEMEPVDVSHITEEDLKPKPEAANAQVTDVIEEGDPRFDSDDDEGEVEHNHFPPEGGDEWGPYNTEKPIPQESEEDDRDEL